MKIIFSQPVGIADKVWLHRAICTRSNDWICNFVSSLRFEMLGKKGYVVVVVVLRFEMHD